MRKGIILSIIGIIIQTITFLITKSTILSFVSGIVGIIAVVKCSERDIKFYFWSTLQLITYAIICYQSQLYGKLLETFVYFVFLIIGLCLWKKHINNGIVKTQKLESYKGIIAFILLFISILVPILYYLGDPNPVLDSSTTIIGIFAQLLMILRMRECWKLWIIQDILCIILWISVNNWCMVAQYSFWLINSIYGLKMWKNEKII